MDNIYGFYFREPLWLAGMIILVPVVWLGMKNLITLSKKRRFLAIFFRFLVIAILIALLAEPVITKMNRRMTLIAVIDRSQSIPPGLQQASIDYLANAIEQKEQNDRFAVIDIAENANISRLPSNDTEIKRRNTTLKGQQSNLADGIQKALAISPPDTGTRIVLVSEGNETEGDLKEAAKLAAMNSIPIDVLPLHYDYENEVVFRRIVAPAKTRSSQTISLSFVLESKTYAKGKLQLNLNGKEVDLDSESQLFSIPIELEPGTNKKTISIPVGQSGTHEFEAVFIPDDENQDRIIQNNRASAITYVVGPGHVLIVDSDAQSGEALAKALSNANINVKYTYTEEFPDNLSRLMDTDAIIIANSDSSKFTYQQQEMICRYVNDLGGGLVMTGGPQAFGAGGWIGSPVAEILPVDLDPPQKKQMPKGALILVIDRSGSMTGEKVEICKYAASAAVRLLSQRDIVGVVAFDAASEWLVPAREAKDKNEMYEQIENIGAGGGTIMGPAMEMAYNELIDTEAAIKHVILLTDGQTSDREFCIEMGNNMAAESITVSTVAIGPERNDQLLYEISETTGGRYYAVDDPMKIPEIFIKEATVIKRPMIIEQSFTPQVISGFNEIIKGFTTDLPMLDGYILTGPKGGLNQVILASNEVDPVLASCQSGIGRAVAFTSSTDSRWSSSWLQWSDFDSFWEQAVRWVSKAPQSMDCDVTTDVQGNQVFVNVEAIDSEGKYIQFSNIEGRIISPDVSIDDLDLIQIGPGQYSGRFQTQNPGSYIVNLRYKKTGDTEEKTLVTDTAITIPFAPEFRDLSDNMPLLTQVTEITGGRMLGSDPNQANLFDYNNVKFPEAQIPLTKPLMYIWLAFFLLDVAIRRLAFDFKAIARKAISFVTLKKKEKKTDATIDILKEKRKQVLEQFQSRSKQVTARKYVADENFEGDLPIAKAHDKKPLETKVKNEEPVKQKTSENQEESSHIERLLKAKRNSNIRQ